MRWLDKAYHWLLWLGGFQEGEHVSDMLARQKARIGGWWWVLVAITLLIILGVFIAALWLTRHIATYKLRRP